MLELISIFLLALVLSFDTFAVSVSTGVTDVDIEFRSAIRIAIILAFFQGLMPLIGWIAGIELEKIISDYDHWVAFFLLLALGLKMLYESIQIDIENRKNKDIHQLKIIVGMAIATSIDAMVVGITLAFVNINIYISIIIIAAVTFFISMLGILFGKKLGKYFGKKMDAIGGLILIAIAFKILLSY